MRMSGLPRVDPRARGGAWALVLRIIDAVAVAVLADLAAGRIHFGSGRRVGALVEPVGDAVRVGVDRAAGRVHHGAGGRIGTLVHAIRHTVEISVGGATF